MYRGAHYMYRGGGHYITAYRELPGQKQKLTRDRQENVPYQAAVLSRAGGEGTICRGSTSSEMWNMTASSEVMQHTIEGCKTCSNPGHSNPGYSPTGGKCTDISYTNTNTFTKYLALIESRMPHIWTSPSSMTIGPRPSD